MSGGMSGDLRAGVSNGVASSALVSSGVVSSTVTNTTSPAAPPKPAAPAPRRFDPYAADARRTQSFLGRLNPLAKIAGPAAAMLLVIFARDLATPITLIVIAYALLLIGGRLSRGMLAVLLIGAPLAIAVISLSFALWADTATVDHTVPLLHIGDWTLYSGALIAGLATGLRLGAVFSLALIGGLTTNGPDLVRAMVQQLRVPYRIGYTALAAYRFVPRFGYELEVIRAAHRVRGLGGGRGPIAWLRRTTGTIVPLLASAIRHAEHVALAMDSRAFGAYPTRTERYLVPFRARDWVFMIGFWVLTAAVFWFWSPWGAGF